MSSCVNIGGNDKAQAAVSIMGRESINKQCWECANCKEPTAGWDRSKFRCAHLGKDFGTWHYDVPNECPCKGKGWIPKNKERRREVNTKIDMTGTWFVYYGISNMMEGCNTIAIEGNFGASEITAYITDAIVRDLSNAAKEIVNKHGPLIIRNMTRLSPLWKEGGAK